MEQSNVTLAGPEKHAMTNCASMSVSTKELARMESVFANPTLPENTVKRKHA